MAMFIPQLFTKSLRTADVGAVDSRSAPAYR
jgi:hypothetical protein